MSTTWYDTVATLGFVAALTQRIRLLSYVWVAPYRHPLVTAKAFATLDALSGGRALLGLGVSGPQVVEGWHGQPFGKPLGRTREYVAIVRAILARRKPLEHAGEHYQIPYRGPDATGLGWVYQYVLEDTRGLRSLAELRAIQDWYLRYQLTAVPGVSEVASVGGFEKTYEVTVDPTRLRAYGISITRVMQALEASNQDVGAMMMELSEREYMVRGLGYLRGLEDIENVVVGATRAGTPALSRRKSMRRKRRLWPPPRCQAVTRP